jgi:diguanylate cyclase (GGDEF)-like protein
VIVGGAPVINAESEITGSMGVFTDITERKRAEEQLVHDAFHDGLTGLANRTLFTNHLQMTIERGKRSEQALYAVLFLDFDRFKVINDSLGHAEGDNLLKQIARRLELSLRTGDLLARLGGDEFTILLNELEDTEDAVQVAERIKNDLNIPFMLGEQEVFMSASIGIAVSCGGHNRAEDMLRDADIAMYRAKSKGKAQHQVFDQTMHKYAINKLQLETEMHHALQRGEFCLYYQPIINLEMSNLKGFEALIRWNHPERGVIPPNEFILAAEENGLIIPLGRWILYESCRKLREWQINNPWASSLSVSVNLSTKQFMQSDLYEQVAAALISTQLDPRCLKLEITESQVMENSDKAVSMMNRLREMGVELSLDDFGTGYSSLSYLHRLPIDYIKIDRSFVNRMVESKENGEIVYTIIKLAQNLKMKVIAEGIETPDQLAQLHLLNCEYGQGYFFSRPLEARKTGTFINDSFDHLHFLTNEKVKSLELKL